MLIIGSDQCGLAGLVDKFSLIPNDVVNGCFNSIFTLICRFEPYDAKIRTVQ